MGMTIAVRDSSHRASLPVTGSRVTGLQSDTMSEIITANGQAIALGNFNGVCKPDFRVNNAKEFLAAKYGIRVAKGVKMPDVKAMVLASGVTDEAFKLARKSYDADKQRYHVECRKVTALLAADPNYRQSIRKMKTGAVVTFRKVGVAAAKVSAAARIAQLEAKLAALGVVA